MHKQAIITTLHSSKSIILIAIFAGLALVIAALGLRQLVRSAGREAPSLEQSQLTAPVKIAVRTQGMVQISNSDLASVGLTLGRISQSGTRLSDENGMVQFWIEGEGTEQRLYFYGRAPDSIYSDENYYWLTISGVGEQPGTASNASEAIAQAPNGSAIVNPTVMLSDDAYLANLSLEENLVYAVKVEDHDHWYWISLTAPTRQEIKFKINHSSAGPGEILVSLWGSSAAPSDKDHRLQLVLNGVAVTDEWWDGQGAYQIKVNLAEDLLRDGENTLTVIAPGIPGVAADVMLLNSITIQYPRRYVADNDLLEFVSPGGVHRFEGFSGPVDIYDISNPNQAALDQVNFDPRTGYDGKAGSKYLVVGPQGYLHPDRVQRAAVEPDLRRRDVAVDYLVISPSDLIEEIDPLLELRSKEGLRTLAVPLEAVYDQFNYGLPEPAAIRNLLAFAAANWHTAPRYLLLVGDASYDPRGFISNPSINRLPTFFVSTIYGGETASDLGYAFLGGGEWPSDQEGQDAFSGIAVGRIPARDALQVQQYVAKLIQYENEIVHSTPAPAWTKMITAVADGSDAQFQADAQRFLENFPTPFTVDLFAPAADQAGVSETIRNKIDSGSLLLAYFGHGSLQMWGKDQLFSVSDVGLLQNNDQPFVLFNLSCLTGLFTHPQVESLAESLLLKPAGGAVAALAPTSLTTPNDQWFLSQAFAKSLAADPTARLGDHFVAAQKAIPAESDSTRDVLRTFLLFGDPAMNLPNPGD